MEIRSILHVIFLNFVITICLFLFTDFLITKITNPSTDYDEIRKGLRIQMNFTIMVLNRCILAKMYGVVIYIIIAQI